VWKQPWHDEPAIDESLTGSMPAQPPGAEPPEEDLSSGQIVIVLARWVLIATALAITFWSPAQGDLERIKVSLLVILALAVGNFAIHAQLLMGRPIKGAFAYGASAVDLAVITVIMAAFGGMGTSIFVFYYPALLGIALVFPLTLTTVFTLALVGGYTLLILPSVGPAHDLQALAAHVIAMVAVAVIGHLYQRIEADRRKAVRESRAGGTRWRGPGGSAPASETAWR
jgi:hypothetical protein